MSFNVPMTPIDENGLIISPSLITTLEVYETGATTNLITDTFTDAGGIVNIVFPDDTDLEVDIWINSYKVLENIPISDAGIFASDANVVHKTGGETIAGLKNFSDGVLTDAIDESTTDAGVTIDSVVLKDGGADFSGTVKTNTVEKHSGLGVFCNSNFYNYGDFTISNSGTGIRTSVRIESVDSNDAYLKFVTNNVLRFMYYVPASGGIWGINRYDDSGVYVNTPLMLSRSTGKLSLLNGLNVNTIDEYTADAGITAESVLLKDGNISTTGTVTAGGATIGDGGTTDYMTIDDDGVIALYGNARYDDYVQINPGAVSAPGASAATKVSRGLNSAWEYPDNLTRQTSITVGLPANMDHTVAPTLRIGWETPTTSATCKWQLEYLYRKAGEDMSSTSGTSLYADGTSSASANGLVNTDFTLAAPDSDDSNLVMRLTRIGGDAGDTIGDSVYTHGGRLMFKANKL